MQTGIVYIAIIDDVKLSVNVCTRANKVSYAFIVTNGRIAKTGPTQSLSAFAVLEANR